jgi:hypothetical protein
MVTLLCSFWPYLAGAFGAWLLLGLLSRLFAQEDPNIAELTRLRGDLETERRKPPVTIEKLVEKTVDRLVDNPQHLTRIRTLEGEVALIAGLRNQIAQLHAAPAKIVEKLVEKPVVVEKVVEKFVDRPVDRVVEKLVDNPLHLSRIKALENDVSVIAGLRSQIAHLQATPPRVVEKVVEKVVTVEKPVHVEKPIDNPMHLARIRSLEGEVALITGLRSQIDELRSAPPKIIEKIVEKPVDKIVEKTVDRLVPDTAGLAQRDEQIRSLQARYADLEGRYITLERWWEGPDLDLEAAKRAGFSVKGQDNLEIIEGIGPKIAELLRQNGVSRFMQLARMSSESIKGILEQGGSNYSLAVPDTWPEQAELAARNRWTSLKALQTVLDAGVRR